MKKTVFLLCATLFATLSYAQTCTVDSNLIQTGGLLSPAPYSADSQFYNLAIACIDQPYNQSVTVNVPPDFNGIPIIDVSIPTTGGIAPYPAGMTYSCSPPNCVFPAGTLGCILLAGTPNGTNVPDTLDMGITATVNTPLAPLTLVFPGQVAQGQHYYLILQPAGCSVGTNEPGTNDQFSLLQNTPNPFGYETVIHIESLVSGDFEFEVFNLFGQRVSNRSVQLVEGANQFTFDAGSLPNGSYYYTLGNRQVKASRMMVIAR